MIRSSEPPESVFAQAGRKNAAPMSSRIDSHTKERPRRALEDAVSPAPSISDVMLKKEANEWVNGYLIGVRRPAQP
jgi:hypothetical protein